MFLSLLEWSGSNPIDQARPTVVALVATRPVFLVSLILAAFAVAVLTEVFVKACENRMAIHAIALLIQVVLLAAVLWGFFLSFYIPAVRIP